ncbi:hypothetical protein ACFPRL_29245 [Pseudoclavibacter helvolus]
MLHLLLDEVHNASDLFERHRGVVEERHRRGRDGTEHPIDVVWRNEVAVAVDDLHELRVGVEGPPREPRLDQGRVLPEACTRDEVREAGALAVLDELVPDVDLALVLRQVPDCRTAFEERLDALLLLVAERVEI